MEKPAMYRACPANARDFRRLRGSGRYAFAFGYLKRIAALVAQKNMQPSMTTTKAASSCVIRFISALPVDIRD
jgi:hypothetical protein